MFIFYNLKEFNILLTTLSALRSLC